MNCYSFYSRDQAHVNWLTANLRPEHPYVFYKERYRHLRCPACPFFSHDEVFKEGFDNDVRIRADGDIFTSSEGFECISRKLQLLVEEAGFGGLDLKPVCDGKWFVVNVSCRVRADPAVYTIGKARCSGCGRPKEISGLFDYLSQIEPPIQGGTFFAPVFDRGGNWNRERDLFATEDVVRKLKERGIKGGYFTRLLDQTEEKIVRDRMARGQLFKLPRGAQVFL